MQIRSADAEEYDGTVMARTSSVRLGEWLDTNLRMVVAKDPPFPAHSKGERVQGLLTDSVNTKTVSEITFITNVATLLGW